MRAAAAVVPLTPCPRNTYYASPTSTCNGATAESFILPQFSLELALYLAFILSRISPMRTNFRAYIDRVWAPHRAVTLGLGFGSRPRRRRRRVPGGVACMWHMWAVSAWWVLDVACGCGWWRGVWFFWRVRAGSREQRAGWGWPRWGGGWYCAATALLCSCGSRSYSARAQPVSVCNTQGTASGVTETSHLLDQMVVHTLLMGRPPSFVFQTPFLFEQN